MKTLCTMENHSQYKVSTFLVQLKDSFPPQTEQTPSSTTMLVYCPLVKETLMYLTVSHHVVLFSLFRVTQKRISAIYKTFTVHIVKHV